MIHLFCKPELLTCGHVHNVIVVPYVKVLDVHALDWPVLLVVVSVVADVEGVVVLKEAASCAICVVCAIFVV